MQKTLNLIETLCIKQAQQKKFHNYIKASILINENF